MIAIVEEKYHWEGSFGFGRQGTIMERGSTLI